MSVNGKSKESTLHQRNQISVSRFMGKVISVLFKGVRVGDAWGLSRATSIDIQELWPELSQ